MRPKRPCPACGSMERASNGQCPCRNRAYRERRAGRTEAPPAPRVEGEAGVVTLTSARAAAFLAWLPASEVASTSVEVRAAGDRCWLRVTPAVAYSLWQTRHDR